MLNLKCFIRGHVNKFCPHCNKNVKEEDFYTKHINDCYKRACCEGSIVKLPEEGATMPFENYKNTLARPFIVYCDTESTLEKNRRNTI